MKLMLGSGIFRRQGWLTLDVNPEHNADFIKAIPPVPDEVKAIRWEELEWIHGVTYLYPWDANSVLEDLAKIIRPGGRLILEQPNFEIAKATVAGVFGNAEHIKNPLLMNRWAYTPESLEELLFDCGFKIVEVMPAQHHIPGRDFRIEAYV
jgi:hypothetical protein